MIPPGIPFTLDENLKPDQFCGFDIHGDCCLSGFACTGYFWNGHGQAVKVTVGKAIFDELKHIETIAKSRAALSHLDTLLEKK